MISAWGSSLGGGEKKPQKKKPQKETPTNLKYVIISRPTLPVAALMELIVLKNNKTRGEIRLWCVEGEDVQVPKTHGLPQKAPPGWGDTEAVPERGRIVFIWAEIKMEQLPWGRL